MFYPVEKWLGGLSLVNVDTLELKSVSIRTFLDMCSNGEIMGSINKELIVDEGLSIDGLSDMLDTRHFVYSDSPDPIDMKLTNDYIMFFTSNHKSSWRLCRLQYIKNNILAYGDGKTMYIWYKGMLCVLTNVCIIYGLYLSEDNLYFRFGDTTDMIRVLIFNGEIEYDSKYMEFIKCSLAECRRRVLL